jgi:hypothetical protein
VPSLLKFAPTKAPKLADCCSKVSDLRHGCALKRKNRLFARGTI